MAKHRKFCKQSIKRQTKDKIKSRICVLNSQTINKSQRSKKLKDLANANKKFVINLANENFSNAELSVSGRGLKFIDIPKPPKAILLDRDTEAFMRIYFMNVAVRAFVTLSWLY